MQYIHDVNRGQIGQTESVTAAKTLTIVRVSAAVDNRLRQRSLVNEPPCAVHWRQSS